MTISIPDLEQRAALGWRAPEEERLGDWLLRAAGGFTGRANSALATGHPGCPLDQAARAVQDWYQARGLPAMIAVPYPAGRPAGDPGSTASSRSWGWSVRSGTATVMTARPEQVARVAGPVQRPGARRRSREGPGTRADGGADGSGMDPEPSEEWLALYHYRGQPSLPPIARQVLTSAPWQAFASIRDGGGRPSPSAGWPRPRAGPG